MLLRLSRHHSLAFFLSFYLLTIKILFLSLSFSLYLYQISILRTSMNFKGQSADINPLKRCQEKLAYFRLKDLQDLLGQLSMAKQGRKQELMDRILYVLQLHTGPRVLNPQGQSIELGIEGIEKLIDNIYSNIPGKKLRGEVVPNEKQPESVRVRCLCGSTLFLEPMIQCEDKKCRIHQHAGCVIIPDPLYGTFNIPTPFLCEICRITRADPFWMTMAHLLLPIKLAGEIVTDGVNACECMEKSVFISNHHMHLLKRTEYELQVWTMLVNDEVRYRIQWPLCCNLHVNGVPVQVTSRCGSQLLGINSRDDGALIKKYCKEELNKITIAWQDTRTYCIGIRIAKRRSQDQVISMIPKKGEGETFEEALVRVCRCIGGGNDIKSNGANNDNDSDDLELLCDEVAINLRCPIGGKRIKIAARFKPCSHMACFDLPTFVQINSHACKWQCPICLKNYCLEDLIIDPYFARILSVLENYDEELTEIEVKKDGQWRIKIEGLDYPWQSTEDLIANTNMVQRETGLDEPEKFENTPLIMPNTKIENQPPHFGELPVSNSFDPNFQFPQFPQFYPDFSGNLTSPINYNNNLPAISDWNPNFVNVPLPSQNDWIPFSLATGIVQQVPGSLNGGSSANQNLSSMSSSSEIFYQATQANNQTIFPNPATRMNYDNFSNSRAPQFNHATDPNFHFF